LLSHSSLIVLACTGRNVQFRKFTQLRIPGSNLTAFTCRSTDLDRRTLQRLRTQFFRGSVIQRSTVNPNNPNNPHRLTTTHESQRKTPEQRQRRKHTSYSHNKRTTNKCKVPIRPNTQESMAHGTARSKFGRVAHQHDQQYEATKRQNRPIATTK
jgi:hypothetical protein